MPTLSVSIYVYRSVYNVNSVDTLELRWVKPHFIYIWCVIMPVPETLFKFTTLRKCVSCVNTIAYVKENIILHICRGYRALRCI